MGVLGETIINTLSGGGFRENMDVYLHLYLQTTNIKMVICQYRCLEINKSYGNGLAMLDSLVMCTVYTNTFTFGQLKVRLGL